MSMRIDNSLPMLPLRQDGSLFDVFLKGDIFDTFNPEKLKILFMIGANVNEVEKEHGRNFLQECIVEEFSLHESEGEIFKEMIELLIKKGIDLDHQDNYGNTALHLAIMMEEFDMAALLIENGARKSIVNNAGHDAYHYFCESESEEQDWMDLLKVLVLNDGVNISEFSVEDSSDDYVPSESYANSLEEKSNRQREGNSPTRRRSS